MATESSRINAARAIAQTLRCDPAHPGTRKLADALGGAKPAGGGVPPTEAVRTVVGVPDIRRTAAGSV